MAELAPPLSDDIELQEQGAYEPPFNTEESVDQTTTKDKTLAINSENAKTGEVAEAEDESQGDEEEEEVEEVEKAEVDGVKGHQAEGTDSTAVEGLNDTSPDTTGTQERLNGPSESLGKEQVGEEVNGHGEGSKGVLGVVGAKARQSVGGVKEVLKSGVFGGELHIHPFLSLFERSLVLALALLLLSPSFNPETLVRTGREKGTMLWGTAGEPKEQFTSI